MTATLCPTCGYQNPGEARACASCGTPLALTGNAAHVLPPGTKLREGAYTVGRVLGQGGFGITYLGSDSRLARPVAVKELFPYGSLRQGKLVVPGNDWTPASFTGARKKFEEEARVLARFHHPGIVRVYSVFEENQTSYMVMEYLRGKSLGGLLDERGGPLEEAEAVNVVLKVGEALAVVHGSGLLHRDLKPDNVVLTDTGRTVLIDFGTAREFATGRTHKMTAMLTPGYAPLEQYSQQARFGTFTDVYALAATLYHLLTGQLPVSALDRIQGVDLPAVRKLNASVSQASDTAVMRGMEMEVAKRPQTVQEFLTLLPGGGAQSSTTPHPTAEPASATAVRPSPVPYGEAPAVPSSPHAGVSASNGTSGRSPKAPLPPPSTPAERPRSRPLRRPQLEHHLEAHTHWVNSIAFAPNSTLLASGSQDNTVVLWNALTGQGRKRLSGGGGPLLGALGAIFAVAFSPDGETIATGGNDDIVRFWETNQGSYLSDLPTAGGNVNSLAYSPDGSLLAIGGQFLRTELWDTRTKRTYRVLTGHALSVVTVAFSPDGRTLVTGSEDGSAILWDLVSGEALGSLAGHRGAVRSVAFSPDGRWLATGSDDFTVNLWDLDRGVLDSSIAEHGGGVRCVAFSPDNRLLASGGDDLSLKLWDLRRGALWYTLTGHFGTLTSAAFSPNGDWVATGSMDRTVQVWRIR